MLVVDVGEAIVEGLGRGPSNFEVAIKPRTEFFGGRGKDSQVTY